MEVMIDISAFRYSVSQPGTFRIRLDDGSTLGDALRQVATEEELGRYLLDGGARGEVRFAVNGVVVSDLEVRLTDQNVIVALPVLDGG